MRANTIFVTGPRLFNVLPKLLRDTTNVRLDCFKRRLDVFLDGLPDEPPVYPGHNGNSILDWITQNRLTDGYDVTVYGSSASDHDS